jgi:hypothetical protein
VLPRHQPSTVRTTLSAEKNEHRKKFSGSVLRSGDRSPGLNTVEELHGRTYRRLVKELENLKCEYFGCLAVQFKFPGFEHPDQLEEDDLGYRKVRPYRGALPLRT